MAELDDSESEELTELRQCWWADPSVVVSLHKRALIKWHRGITESKLTDLQHRAAAGFYQAGVYYHKDLLLREVLESFEQKRATGDPISAALPLLLPDNAKRAARYYEIAIALWPEFAEAIYNRASLFKDAGNHEEAKHLFERVLSLPPHPKAREAFLHANAAWEAANLAVAAGKLSEAGDLFAFALARLDNYGVDHRNFADYLDLMDKPFEAVDQYDRTLAYSHRYAAEFVEPDYAADERLPSGSGGEPLDPLVAQRVGTSTAGAPIIHFLCLYFTLPNSSQELDEDDLIKVLRRSRFMDRVSSFFTVSFEKVVCTALPPL